MQRRTTKTKAPSPMAIANGVADMSADESLASGD